MLKKLKMPELSDLQNPTITGRIRGAYRKEGQFLIDGLNSPTGLEEILQYIFDNLGGGGPGNDNFISVS